MLHKEHYIDFNKREEATLNPIKERKAHSQDITRFRLKLESKAKLKY